MNLPLFDGMEKAVLTANRNRIERIEKSRNWRPKLHVLSGVRPVFVNKQSIYAGETIKYRPYLW